MKLLSSRMARSLFTISGIIGTFGWMLCAQALGISPSYIEIDGIRNGNAVERTIFITRPEADETQYYSIELKNEGKEFIHLKSNILKFSPGVKKVPLDFSVEPRQAVPKNYLVEVVVHPTGVETGVGISSLSSLSSISGKIRFSVTDQEISNFLISSISLDSPLESPKKFTLSFMGANSGNVPVMIDTVTVEGLISGSVVFNEKIPIVSGLVPPLTNTFFSQILTKSLSLPDGNYSFKINVYSKGTVVGTDTIIKTIGKRVATISSIQQQPKSSGKIIFLVGILIILCIGIFLVFQKKFKNN